MESTTDTGNIITPLNRANFQLEKTIFSTVTIISYVFSQVLNKSLNAALEMWPVTHITVLTAEKAITSV